MSGTIELFVYGTLGPDGEAWDYLEPYVRAVAAVTVPGQLFDTGRGYPAAVFEAGTSVVHGWRCTLVDFPITELDSYEGDEYTRGPVRCSDGVVAEAYHWTASLAGCEPIPDGRFTGGPTGR